jgi:hypothetical protein
MQAGDDASEQEAEISEKDFTLAFARCLCGTVREAEMEEMLEQRAEDYRKIGQLFGMEKMQQHFSWNKFALTFFSDTFAFISFPLCKFLEHLRPSADTLDGEGKSSLYDVLTECQWLPLPFASFDAFQHYLMSLWGPSMFSIVSYCVFYRYMQHISLMEVLSPLMIYCIIGTYMATISGYEHPKLVLRRLNMHLSSEVRQNELHAVFAFRAHTPEGHAVNQIGTIADVLFKNKFHWWTQTAAALAGILHACAPVFHRIVVVHPQTYDPKICGIEHSNAEVCGESAWKLVFWWAAGGNSMAHMMVSVPAAAISGYLSYRLIVISGGCLYHDLSFYYKLILFRACTQAEPFLRYRARWIRAQMRMANFKGRREFLQFLNLQKHDDLVQWCRIRSLLIESYSGFKSKQHDILVTYILLYTLSFTLYILVYQIRSRQNELSVFDIRVRLDVFVFSLLLIVIINLKLNIHALRKSDISLLHKEYYAASMSSGMLLAAGGMSVMPPSLSSQIEMAEDALPRTQSLSEEPSRPPPFLGRTLSSSENLYNVNGGGLARTQSSARMAGSSSRFQAAIVRRQNRSAPSPSCSTPSCTPESPTTLGAAGNKLFGGRTSSGGQAMSQGSAGFGRTASVTAPLRTASGGIFASLGIAAGPGDNVHVVQNLLDHTARYIQEFDRPPRLLSFTVSVHFLRYIFLPLLSPLIAHLNSWSTGHAKK